MPDRPASKLLLEILFGQTGNSSSYIGEGWADVEPAHRWTVGRRSSIRLELNDPGPDCILVIDALPWCDGHTLPVQTVMLAINDRLLATLHLSDHRTLAFPLPSGLPQTGGVWLDFIHLNASTPRPDAGLDRNGAALGLLMTRLRVFRLPQSSAGIETRDALPGKRDDGSLQHAVAAATGLAAAALAMRFESIGHNCEFGLVQRGLGAEPLGLLRFASVVTHALVEGVMQRFQGVGHPAMTRVYLSEPPEPEFKIHEQTYYLWYSTGKTAAEAAEKTLHAEQCRRLVFLQRKFEEDLAEGGKIYVVTRAEVLSYAEALALYCALALHGPNVLLWTVHGDAARAGQVDRLLPGFLCGHLGEVDDIYYAGWDAWLSVLCNAFLLSGLGERR